MKKRLDLLLLEKGLIESRERARGLIMAGAVYVDGQKEEKPGAQVLETAELSVREKALPFVSRGGLKLEKAVKVFGLTLSGAVAADIGASTGGFTDCMLKEGASRVYAVDVGYGQLAWSLRTDARVVVLERTNARNLTEKEIPEPLDFASIDVSFISLEKILPALLQRLRPGGEVVALIKPQFEVGKGKVGKNGVVRDEGDHVDVIARVISFARGLSFLVKGLDFSPIRGPKGNIEYLLYLRGPEDVLQPEVEIEVPKTVKQAHNYFKGRDTID